MSDAKSADYKQGFCDGFNEVMAMVRQNRAHFRKLSDQPEMSSGEVLAAIYADTKRAPLGTIVSDTVRTVVEAIDLYLIPPFTDCRIDEKGEVVRQSSIGQMRG